MQKFSVVSLLAVALLVPSVSGWDYEGHRIVNQLGLAALPADFPAFVHEPANAERIAFLSGEPDRWRNTADLPIRQANGLDHYCDLEQLADAGLDAAALPALRYEFALRFAAGRAAHPEKFSPIDPARNPDGTREWPGFSPWAIVELYGKLKSAFSYLKAFEETGGTAGEIANARANIVYVMGVMGHYVGDGAQPLHVTMHHHGWVGENPQGYTTWTGIHGWIDSGFIAKAGINTAGLAPKVVPAVPLALTPAAAGRDPAFVEVMKYLVEQYKSVEPLYALEKAGKLSHEPGEPVVPEGRAFIEARLQAGSGMLARLWLTAWKQAAPDVYLRTQLLKRQGAAAPAAK